MERKLRIAQYGCGKMSVYTMRYAATVELTCATIVNRIPDLIAAAPGFTTTEKMPTSAFRAKNLSFCVED